MRLRFVFLAGAIFGGLLGYYALWSHLMSRVEAGVQAFQVAQKAQGRRFDYRGTQRGGFPYRLSLRLDGVSWSDPRGSAWSIESDALVAHLQFWSNQHIVFELFGSQSLAWRDATGPHRVSVLPERGRASLVLDGADRWLRFAADLQNPSFGSALEGYSAQRLQLHLRQGGNVPPTQDVALQIAELMLPARLDGPLGRQIKELSLVGKQTGPWVGTTPEEALAGWRDSGGIVEFSTIALHWGKLRLSGDGSLTVDKQLRPLGAMGGKLHGAETGIDALVAAGKMKLSEAAPAKMALMAAQKKDAADEAYLPLPLSAQDGWLSIAKVQLFPLTPLLTLKK